MRVLLIGMIAAAAVGGTVQAQTHPCDQTIAPDPVIASAAPHKAAFCQPQTDLIEAAIAYVDGVAVDLLAVTPKTGPSATGMVLYETPLFIQVSRGAHILEMASYNRNTFTGELQMGSRSVPFPFSADDSPVPAGPTVKGILR
jgi:hypothetical protein